MKNKNWLKGILMMSMLTGCNAAAESVQPRQLIQKDVIEIDVLTDIHYLADDLFDENSEIFQKLMASGDGKLTEYMPEVMDAYVEKTLENPVDVVIVTGDITFNGEMDSLLEMKEKLQKLKDAGMEVLVIPGNHDINYSFSQKYFGDKARYVDNISQDDFRSVMKPFGVNGSVTSDDASFSYLYQITDDLYVMGLDTNLDRTTGVLDEKTVSWMKGALSSIDGHQVITFSHQNVLRQSDLLYVGFQMDNGDEVAEILKQHGVQLNLSGHSHLQHTSVDETLTDICNESMALYPLSYGHVTYDTVQKTYDYSRISLNLYLEEAKERFSSRARTQIREALENAGTPSSVQDVMIEFAAGINLALFTGDELDLQGLASSQEWSLWKTYGTETFWYQYLSGTLEG